MAHLAEGLDLILLLSSNDDNKRVTTEVQVVRQDIGSEMCANDRPNYNWPMLFKQSSGHDVNSVTALKILSSASPHPLPNIWQ
jgi:hypothetical protein